MSRYALFGRSVSKSLSPQIHAAFARQTGIAMEYVGIDAEPDALDAAMDAFAASGGRGANITVPHKEAAFARCTVLSERARLAGAVNTLRLDEAQWYGDNTDGAGLIRDLTGRHGLDLRGRRTLLLGAGGAARGIAPALLEAGVRELVIVNRNPERADALADVLGEPARAHTRYWEDLATIGDFELVINATSAGRYDGVPLSLPFALCNDMTAAVDLNYSEVAIPFLAWARTAGLRTIVDGLGMLIEQAAESFEVWHGVRPDTDAVYALLRQQTPEPKAG
ncbi:shikimate dehydrogenase [Pseudoxanthomonas sp. GM95]|uniref:shikimate dehydrogenase n=1 Tax=Pseudoxanthomonas sp. GM95 TaxID=1881043 RepID=UPI0008C5F3BE|nr:shikimate dehydrogenase [Pseudoxanthomonas sp. GM95]SEM17766.1 shikimate dehydrogenase [Pseudoxanthomonas sp. GM95]